MMTDPKLAQVLDFRDKKQSLRQRLQGRCGGAVVSLSVNMPGPEKRGLIPDAFFHEGVFVLTAALEEAGGAVTAEILLHEGGCAAVFAAGDLEAPRLKALCCAIEEGHPLGRLWDIDIWLGDEQLGRQQLGLQPRPCLICGEEAKLCARRRSHSIPALRERIEEICTAWRRRQQQEAQRLGDAAYAALIAELELAPKPGLVCPASRGAHSDMDAECFRRSAEALRPYFIRLAALGLDETCPPAELFQKARALGMEAEAAMLSATGGVNTHKGAIFTLGILCAAAGRCIKMGQRLDAAVLRRCVISMVFHTLTKELENMGACPSQSHGEENFRRHGTRGARGEAIEGFPTLFDVGLKQLEAALDAGLSPREARLGALMALIAATEDSNVIYRSSPATLTQLQIIAADFIAAGGMAQPGALEKIEAIDRWCIARGVSPGGAADLLAAAIFLHDIMSTNLEEVQ